MNSRRPWPETYEFIKKIAIHGPELYEFMGEFAVHGPEPHEFIVKIAIYASRGRRAGGR